MGDVTDLLPCHRNLTEVLNYKVKSKSNNTQPIITIRNLTRARQWNRLQLLGIVVYY